jgi:hypothetical protein
LIPLSEALGEHPSSCAPPEYLGDFFLAQPRISRVLVRSITWKGLAPSVQTVALYIAGENTSDAICHSTASFGEATMPSPLIPLSEALGEHPSSCAPPEYKMQSNGRESEVWGNHTRVLVRSITWKGLAPSVQTVALYTFDPFIRSPGRASIVVRSSRISGGFFFSSASYIYARLGEVYHLERLSAQCSDCCAIYRG